MQRNSTSRSTRQGRLLARHPRHSTQLLASGSAHPLRSQSRVSSSRGSLICQGRAPASHLHPAAPVQLPAANLTRAARRGRPSWWSWKARTTCGRYGGQSPVPMCLCWALPLRWTTQPCSRQAHAGCTCPVGPSSISQNSEACLHRAPSSRAPSICHTCRT
jgi:hypothetical protein